MSASGGTNQYTRDQVAAHNTQKDLWIIIDEQVYDITSFQKKHPGGAAVLLQMAGRDATEAANAAHKGSEQPAETMKLLHIGSIVKDAAEVRGGSRRRTSVGQEGDPGAVPGLGTKADAGRRDSTFAKGPSGKAEAAAAEEHVGDEVDSRSLRELVLNAEEVREARAAWEAFCASADSREAAGEAIFNAIFESAPALQRLFVTPRAVQDMRFMASLGGFVQALDQPGRLLVLVEAVGFGHLNLEVTAPRVVVFRDAIIKLFELELLDKFTEVARDTWTRLLNYIGGAIIYIKAHYADRLKILAQSWSKANNKDATGHKGAADTQETSHSGQERGGRSHERSHEAAGKGGKAAVYVSEDEEGNQQNQASHVDVHAAMKQTVPTTFKEMFEFNAAVMGFSSSGWMREVLASFDTIVTNVSNSARLQEECDILVIRISKKARGAVNLAEYKSCMLASLRSLLPKDWDQSYEIAWNWLWENVERMLRRDLNGPQAWERALSELMGSLDEDVLYGLRQETYARFFQAAPAGQEYFKQSDTRLHFIAEQVMQMTLALFDDPWKMVDDISALGLRHVGYGIPTELFGPFVTASIEVVGTATQNQTALEAYRWSLGLISKMLTRTINEGSTIVMKAVNANSAKQLKKSIGCAPRGSRCSWLLNVQVGSQSISPLYWAIESGSFDAAKSIIQDLLTIRADRERYYYGVEDLFTRHPDIIQRLCTDAPQLLPTLLDGLVWRSRQTANGMRRVNYYVKHMLVTPDGGFSDVLRCLVAYKDPKIMDHPVVVLASDTLWNGLVRRQFIYSRVWFVLSLAVLMLSQALLPKVRTGTESDMAYRRVMIFTGRIMNYLFTMCRLFAVHLKRSFREYRAGETFRACCCVPLPRYVRSPGDAGSVCLMLMLFLMLTHEPMFYCINQADVVWPHTECEAADDVRFMYSVFCMCAMGIHWLLLMDLCVFSTGLSAFVLVVGQVLSEIGRFIFALIFLLLTFGSAISVLEHDYYEMRDIPRAAVALFAITLRLYEDDYRNLQFEPALLAAVFLFVMVSVIILLNLLIAQLNCSYVYIYQDVVGFARLNRAEAIVEMLDSCPEAKWSKFVATLGLNEPLEFNEGDIGLSGGIQVTEPASLHPVVADSIFRFGGSCSEDMQWPEESAGHDRQHEDKYERMERLVNKAMKRILKLHNQNTAKRAGGEAKHNHSNEGRSLDDGSSSCASSR